MLVVMMVVLVVSRFVISRCCVDESHIGQMDFIADIAVFIRRFRSLLLLLRLLSAVAVDHQPWRFFALLLATDERRSQIQSGVTGEEVVVVATTSGRPVLPVRRCRVIDGRRRRRCRCRRCDVMGPVGRWRRQVGQERRRRHAAAVDYQTTTIRKDNHKPIDNKTNFLLHCFVIPP